MAEALRILLGGVEVGILEYAEGDEAYEFSFSESYLKDPSRPVLGQIFEDRRPYSISTSGMPCWFANLLPQNVLRRILAKALEIAENDNFHLLQALGSDLPGAVIAEPAEPRVSPSAWSSGHSSRVHGPQRELPFSLKFSLAGIQMKLSVREDERGLVVPVKNGQTGRWIAKFDALGYPSLPRVEYATMKWAQESQIAIPDVRLATVDVFEDLPEAIPTGEGSVFLIRRFDRSGDSITDRVHMEDFAQILDRPPGDAQYYGSYEEIAAVLSYISPSSLQEFVNRLVFTVLCGNGDAHLKNWSLIYPDRRSPELSPAYDFVSTLLYLPHDDLALTLGGSKVFSEISLRKLVPLAVSARVDPEVVSNWARDATVRILESWQASSPHFAFTDEERRVLSAHLGRLPIVRDCA